jgi:hypothetical protein
MQQKAMWMLKLCKREQPHAAKGDVDAETFVSEPRTQNTTLQDNTV